MLITEILKKKRDGGELSAAEIKFIISGLKNKSISDIQISSFLMACCINGMSFDETAYLTFEMRDSGKKFNFSSIKSKKVDKHSTGGVGDKISLLLTPICMSFNIALPMISGRGLGHTGGTVDKLESIEGFRIRLDPADYDNLLKKNGVFMACQTDDIAPADKKLYHIRDVTGTVESVGLITASILSKKLVENLDVLIIDMKVGNGAFMQNMDEARRLAESMMYVTGKAGLKLKIIFSSMQQPLGYKIGNWLEVEEVIDALKGNCPADIRLLTEKLAASMLVGADLFKKENDAIKQIRKVWNSGEVYDNFVKMIESQNGDLTKSELKYINYPKVPIYAERDGFVTQIDTLYTGICCIMLGAGRKDVADTLDYGAGIILNKKIGNKVSKGEILAWLTAKNEELISPAAELLKNCIIISETAVQVPELIIDEW